MFGHCRGRWNVRLGLQCVREVRSGIWATECRSVFAKNIGKGRKAEELLLKLDRQSVADCLPKSIIDLTPVSMAGNFHVAARRQQRRFQSSDVLYLCEAAAMIQESNKRPVKNRQLAPLHTTDIWNIIVEYVCISVHAYTVVTRIALKGWQTSLLDHKRTVTTSVTTTGGHLLATFINLLHGMHATPFLKSVLISGMLAYLSYFGEFYERFFHACDCLILRQAARPQRMI